MDTKHNEYFIMVHRKDDKATYYVCFQIAKIPVAFKKFTSATAAWAFIHSIAKLDIISFDTSVMNEVREISMDEVEIVNDEPLVEEPKSDTYTPNAVAKKCDKCAMYYKQWDMCKVSGGFASNIKVCTAFKEIGRR